MAKVSWGGRKQWGRGLGVQDGEGNCGWDWTRVAESFQDSVADSFQDSATLLELSGIWHFASHCQAGAV